MSDVFNRLASLSPEERASLVMRLKRKPQDAESTVSRAICRRENRLDAPLSFAQQRLWFLHQLDPGNAAYHLPLYYLLRGQLDIEAFKRSLDEIIRRHEILRTVFRERDGAPLQVVLPALPLELPVVDWSQFSDTESKQEIERLIDTEGALPFDLEQGPLLRAKLLKLSENEHGFFLVIHHIVTDGWSMDLFMSELKTLYEAFSAGEPSPLADPPLQYADFAAWQQEWIKGQVMDEQLAYWKKQLSGDLPMLEVPTDHPRPARMTYLGADEFFDVTQDLTGRLNELGRRAGASLFMTLLAAFLTLLHRYTGQEDVILGTAIAGRNRAETEGVLGFFVNTLVLRTDLSGDPTFRDLLGRVREVAFGAYEHQDLPFEKLVEELQPERDMSRQPFFQVMFNVQTLPAEEPARSGLTILPKDIGNQTRFDLEFHLWIVPEGVAGPLVYNSDLFDEPTIARMLTHYLRLLEGIAANPEARISELPLLSREEREQFREWNETGSEFNREQCLHQMVEWQAARQPEAVAVVCGANQISYGELNGRANQLAHYLRRRGIGLETRVGVLLERSAEWIVTLLGIVKAGGVYVPLDGGYPAQRLNFMLEDAEVRLLLTESGQPKMVAQPSGCGSMKNLTPETQTEVCESMKTLIPETQTEVYGSMKTLTPETRTEVCATGEGIEVLYLDSAGEMLGQESRANLENVTRAENLAYVMYTSGSTGQPKGVGVSHRAINRLVRNTNYVMLESSDRVAQISNASFDAATFEIWGALLNGGQLVVLEKETALSPLDLGRQLKAQQIGAMFLTTALFNQVAQGDPAAFAALRYLMFGGESSDAQAVRRVLAGGKPQHLLNVYGPTEGTTFTTWYEVKEVAAGARTIPIGRSISNTEVWVLDGHGQMAPVGMVGEIFIGGEGLARDYLNRPELTAEKFVPHPYSQESGARLYRTGDLARYLSDGNIEFLKRMDQQVKVRGFRIELEEIEVSLQEHSAIYESVVVTREDTLGDKQLVAYVVTDPDFQATVAEQFVPQLKSWLRERLPEYMVPAFFIILDKLPLNANGKVDRQALPVPEAASYVLADTFVTPRTPEEEKVAEIWAEVLEVGPVSAEANFFDLGGHSLLATRVISRIREACGVELPLRLLFDSPTVAALARHLANAREDQRDVSRIAEIVEKLELLSEDETRSLLQQETGS